MKAGELQAAEIGHKGPSCCMCTSRFCRSSIQSLVSSSRQGELSAHRAASQAQASATYVYQRSPNYASKSQNLTPPQQNVRRSQSERSQGQVCTSSSCCQDRARGVQVISPLRHGAGSNTRDVGTLTLKGLFAVFQLPLFHIGLKYTKCFTHKLVRSCNSVAKETRKTLEPLCCAPGS